MDYGVLFDLDGTLLNTDLLIEKSFRHVFGQYMPDYDLSYEEVLSFMGPSLKDTFERYFDKSMIDELVTCYRGYNIAHHNDFVSIYPHIVETLDALKNKGYKMAVVTTKMTDVARLGLDLFDLTKYFDCVIGMNEVSCVKPDPEGVFKALTILGCKKGVMIGDNKSDILAGKNAGIHTIGVKWTPKGCQDLQQLNPDLMIDDMSEIISFIEGEC